MFKNAIRLPLSLFGIPIQLDISFLAVLPILGWMIGNNVASIVETFGLEIETTWLEEHAFIVGLLTAFGLFVSILIHEIGHSLVAKAYGIEVKSITLWLLGGMATFADMPREKGREAVIAIAGPLTSALVAGLCWVAGRALGEMHVGLVFISGYLVMANLALAIFNCIPALPLDGGRVLRSLLALRMNYARATMVSAQIGKMLAFLLGFLGVISLNLFLVLIAFFVYAAGRGESSAIVAQEALLKLTVADLMESDVQTVSVNLSIPDLLDRMIEDRHQGYPVLDLEGGLAGVISLDLIKLRPPDTSLEGLRVVDLMQSPAPTLRPSEDSTVAFRRMNEEQTDRFVVVDDNDRMVGIVSRTDLLRAIQVRLLEFPHGPS